MLTLPGDVGGARRCPKATAAPHHRRGGPAADVRDDEALARAAALIDAAASVTMLVGIGAREARDEVLALAEHLSAPMVLTLKAKEGLERDNAVSRSARAA